MGYFQVRYDSRVVIYDHRAFIRLTTGVLSTKKTITVIDFSDLCGNKFGRNFKYKSVLYKSAKFYVVGPRDLYLLLDFHL